MFFSVLIPVYNTSAYLEECIESVLAQTEDDYEIVLLNDGSTDNSGDICDQYANKYLNIRVVHKDNEGLLLTRRRGFKEAQGEYYICLDSDDCLADIDALKKIKELILKEHCDLVIYEYIFGSKIGNQNRRINLFNLPNGYVFDKFEKKELYKKLLIGRDFNPIWIKCISKDILDINVDYSDYNKSLIRSQGEDYLQSFPILTAATRIAYLKEPLCFYRWNESSISRNPSIDFYYAYKTMYQVADQYIKLWNIEEFDIQQHKQHRISIIMGILCSGLKEKNAFECKNMIEELSKDSFFKELFNLKDKKQVLLYYRLVAFLINHNYPRSTIGLITIVSGISKCKRRIKQWLK